MSLTRLAAPTRRAIARALLMCVGSFWSAGGASVAAQLPSRAAGEPLRDTLSAEQARSDVALLRRALEEAHGGLYRFVDKPTIDARFDALRDAMRGPQSKSAFIERISATLAAVRDGHMRLEFDSATAGALESARLFPLTVTLEDGRAIVVTNDTPNDSLIRPGMELLAVNGHDVADLVARILPLLPPDGFSATRPSALFVRAFAPHYWLLVDRAGRFSVTVRDDDGRRVTATLDGVTNAERRTSRNPANATISARLDQFEGPRENVSVRWTAAPEVAIVRVRAFGGERMPTELDSVFRLLRERGTRRAVLDLRGNGGGVDLFGAKLVSEFTDRPFRYFDRIHLATIAPSFATWKPQTFEELRGATVADPVGGFLATRTLHPGVAEQPPSPYPFLGSLVVLMSRATFSTAADVVALLRSQRRAVFVGEESGGAYEGNTSGLNARVDLPASGLKLKIMMYQYWNAVTPMPGGRGTLPDYAVQRRIGELIQGVDAPLERALSVVRGLP